MKCFARLLAGGAMLAFAGLASAKDTKLVIYDNDFFGPTSSDIIPLLAAPDVKVLGFAAVSGDSWRDEAAAYLLRSLELFHRTEIPVYLGAVHPLVNSRERLLAWEHMHGKMTWKGAWNDAAPGKIFHPTEPFAIGKLEEGLPTIKPAKENAVDFMIRSVHEHPHEITIIEAGPMTSLALAIRMDPEFASLAKELVFMGALMDTNLKQVVDNPDFYMDFNIMWDPEAAHITLNAPWPKITVVGNISNETLANDAWFKKLTAKKTPVTELLARYPWTVPLWDELTTAIAIDNSLVTKEVAAYMDVDIDQGYNYGAVHVWSDKTAPHLGEQKVHIVLDIDKDRFYQNFIRDAQSDLTTKAR